MNVAMLFERTHTGKTDQVLPLIRLHGHDRVVGDGCRHLGQDIGAHQLIVRHVQYDGEREDEKQEQNDIAHRRSRIAMWQR